MGERGKGKGEGGILIGLSLNTLHGAHTRS